MADLYYINKYVPELGQYALVYTNDPDELGATQFVFDIDNPVTKDQIIWIQLYEDKFEFPEDASGMFYQCSNECFNDMESWLTTGCKNMSYLFSGCTNLKNMGYYKDPTVEPSAIPYYFSINVFDTSAVTNMSHMFEECKKLETLDLYSFDTSNVTDMSYMFKVSSINHDAALNSINVTSFNTSKVTNMAWMFSGIGSSTMYDLDFSSFDTSKVTNMSYMFFGCSATGIQPNNLDFSSCTDASYLLAATRANEYDVSQIDFTNINCYRMFSGCSLLRTVHLGEFDLSSTDSVDGMFMDCYELESVYATPGTDWTQYSQFSSSLQPFMNCYNIHNWSGNDTIKNANNTKAGGYFLVGPKTWRAYTIYVKV